MAESNHNQKTTHRSRRAWDSRKVAPSWSAWVWIPLHIAALAYALIVIDALDIKLPLPVPFLLMIASIVTGGIFGGLKQGLVSAVLNSLLVVYFFSIGFRPLLLDNLMLAIVAFVVLSVTFGTVLGLASDRNRMLVNNLQVLADMQDQFVSNVSHELRSPLTVLKLHHYLLRTHPAELDELLPVLELETHHLERVIEDMLRIPFIKQGRLTLVFTEVDLNQLVAEGLEDRAALAERRSVELVAGEREAPLPVVFADVGLIRDVLRVLLLNAIDYTPQGGTVTVSTRSRIEKGRAFAGFSVNDNGAGVAPDEQRFIFERFYRGAAGRNLSDRGAGLGLAIAHEVVERHRGTIEVESSGKQGEGSTFTVWLPAYQPPQVLNPE